MVETIGDKDLAFDVTKETPPVRFIASLSDGRTVIQDDRSGQKHAWGRLAKWMKNNTSISISNIRLQGPNGFNVAMPSNQNGYFFGKKQIAVWGSGQANYVGVGYYDGQIVNVVWYKQPNFDHTATEERTAAKAGFFLIRNP